MNHDLGPKALGVAGGFFFLSFGAYLFFVGRAEAGTVVLVSALVWACMRTVSARLQAQLPATWRGDVVYGLVLSGAFAFVLTGFHVSLNALGWSDLGSRPLRDLLGSLAFFLVVMTPLTVWLRIRKRRHDHNRALRRRAGPGLLGAEPGQRRPPPEVQGL